MPDELTPPVATPPTEPQGDGLEAVFDNPFEAVDSKIAPKQDAPPEPDKKEVATEPEKAPAKEAAPKTDKKAATPEVDPKAASKPAKHEAAALTAHKEQLLNELKQERAAKAAYEAKIKEYERKDLDTAKLAKKLSETEAEMKRINGELRAAKFTESETYTKNHVKPLERLVAKAKSEIEQLPIIVGKNEETGEVKTRQATWADVVKLFQDGRGMGIIGARRMFGENSPVVEDYLREMHSKVEARDYALQEERENWEKAKADEEAKSLRESEAMDTMWRAVNEDIVKKNPTWFGENPDDPEGNELLKEGYKLVDSAYANQGMTPQQKVLLDAHVRHRAAAFARDQHTIAKLQARVEELEAKQTSKKASAPGAVRREGDGGGAQQASDNPLDDQELMEAFRG